MKPFGLAGKPQPGACGCCWYHPEDCRYAAAKTLYRRSQRKAERQRRSVRLLPRPGRITPAVKTALLMADTSPCYLAAVSAVSALC